MKLLAIVALSLCFLFLPIAFPLLWTFDHNGRVRQWLAKYFDMMKVYKVDTETGEIKLC